MSVKKLATGKTFTQAEVVELAREVYTRAAANPTCRQKHRADCGYDARVGPWTNGETRTERAWIQMMKITVRLLGGKVASK